MHESESLCVRLQSGRSSLTGWLHIVCQRNTIAVLCALLQHGGSLDVRACGAAICGSACEPSAHYSHNNSDLTLSINSFKDSLIHIQRLVVESGAIAPLLDMSRSRQYTVRCV